MFGVGGHKKVYYELSLGSSEQELLALELNMMGRTKKTDHLLRKKRVP